MINLDRSDSRPCHLKKKKKSPYSWNSTNKFAPHSRKRFCTLFFVLLGTFALLKTGYKRVYFDASEWSKYSSKTTLFRSKTIIECGSACVAFGGCDLFVKDKESKNCYLGDLDNVDTNYLTVESGETLQAVYLDLNIIGKFDFLMLM